MTHASLFTGIGGFDLAAEWMGWQNIFQVEIDNWCQRLLAQNFPNAKRSTDIKEFDGHPFNGTIDVLSGGFPCQPYSTAGKRKGKDDDRHLWPEMLRVIREVSPRWVVGENVRGLTNWNGGLVFDEAQSDLETAGYEVLPFLLPAAGVNAPHRRERIWFIAHSSGYGYQRKDGVNDDRCTQREGAEKQKERQRVWADARRAFTEGDVAHTYCEGSQGNACGEQPGFQKENKSSTWCANNRIHSASQQWNAFPTQSPIHRGDDGISYRVDRIKGLGNAVVPQVVLQIFKAIEQYELSRI